MTRSHIGEIAGIIAFISFIPYLVSILRGKTKPSRAGYGIWAVVEVIWASSYISSGATTTKWVGIVFAATAVLIFLLSLKYGMGGFNRFDITCLVLAAIAVILWVTTKNPTVAVYTSTLAALLGYPPIIKKSYLHPESENFASWALYAIAATLNVCALTTMKLTIILRPLLTLPLAYLIVVLLILPKRHRKLVKIG